MNKFYGTARLNLASETRDVMICLDLEQNVVEVSHSPSDMNAKTLFFEQTGWMESPAKLTDIQYLSDYKEGVFGRFLGFMLWTV